MAPILSSRSVEKQKENKEQVPMSSSEESSSEEDEEGEALTEQMEKDWLRTLAALKKKDPKIYDKNIKFYQSSDEETESKKPEKKKEKPIFLHDVQRETLIETKGAPPPDKKVRYEDEYDDADVFVQPVAPSYFEEQNALKKTFMEAAPSSDEEDDCLLVKKKSNIVKEDPNAEEEYRMFLKGKRNKLKKDKRLGPELSILKDYWSKPDLDEGEQFLRDYILNKGYKDNDKNKIPSYKDIVEDEDSFNEEEKVLQKQEDFERDYNFRFEEPDKNFIKSYPRKIADSVRQEDKKRVEKRRKVLERKKKEKEKKQEELKKIKKKKRKEIMDKISELKKITGNSSLGIQDLDLDDEFDEKQHEQMMQKMFNEGNYEGDDGTKPVFSDDGWDETYEEAYKEDGEMPGCSYEEMPGCSYEESQQDFLDIDDPNFNMDADYDVSLRRSKKERKRKKKSKNEKPFYNPDEMTFDEYFDEYYKLDYEDLIEDQPCRFQYRQVVPNDFGLSTKEILNVDDKELNAWCPMRKILQYRTEKEEFDDEMIFYKRGKNLNRKKEYFPSYFDKKNKSENGEEYENGNSSRLSSVHKTGNSKKKERPFNKGGGGEKEEEEGEGEWEEEEEDSVLVEESGEGVEQKKRKKKKKKPKVNEGKKEESKLEEEKERANEFISQNGVEENQNGILFGGEKKKKERKKKRHEAEKEEEERKEETDQIRDEKVSDSSPKMKNKKKRKQETEVEEENEENEEEKRKDQTKQITNEKVEKSPKMKNKKKRKQETELKEENEENKEEKRKNQTKQITNEKVEKSPKMKNKKKRKEIEKGEPDDSHPKKMKKAQSNEKSAKTSIPTKTKQQNPKSNVSNESMHKNNQTSKTTPSDSLISKTRLKKKKRAEMWRKKTTDVVKHNQDLNISLSNERLKAYGLNPKKFKYLKLSDQKLSH